MAWHPTENILSYTNNDGELFIHVDFVPSGLLPSLEKDLQPAPFIHDPLAEVSGNVQRLANGSGPPRKEAGSDTRQRRKGTPDSLDRILGDDGMSDVDEDGFVEDDDGGGYAEEHINGYGKRTNGHLDEAGLAYGSGSKRSRAHGGLTAAPRIHPSFQPGSTPWRGNRRYLCLNLTGFVWTIDQDTHHTITVEFYDREQHRDFHFTDVFLYDKACLNESGALFSCPPSSPTAHSRATIYYRPHETWTARTDWRTQLPAGEAVVAMALSDSYIVVSTSANYIRIFSLYGLPIRVYRQKSSPAVTCAAWRNYILTVGNGPVTAEGATQLLYSIENVKRDETCQNEDIVALRPGAALQSVFFSDEGVSHLTFTFPLTLPSPSLLLPLAYSHKTDPKPNTGSLHLRHNRRPARTRALAHTHSSPLDTPTRHQNPRSPPAQQARLGKLLARRRHDIRPALPLHHPQRPRHIPRIPKTATVGI